VRVGVVVTAVVGDMVNAGEVVDAGISADVTDVTVRNDRAWENVGSCSAGIEASREWALVSSGRTRVGERFADTAGPAFKVSGRTHPFLTARWARVRDFCFPLSPSFALASRSPCSSAFAAPPPLAPPDCPRLRRHDVELDAIQSVP
jgi:hypothetical protein